MIALSQRLAAVFVAVLVLAGIASAEPRVALVVGNEAYTGVSPLDNAVADAQLVATTLTAKGFDVTLVTNASQSELNRAIAQFGRDLRTGGTEATGLFYYAGHAVQSFGANYLLPVDVSLTDAADLSLVAVRADAVLRQMASAPNNANIVILDACRNNPFVDVPDMNDNGLAEMKAPTGTFMAFSTAPGSVALDGSDGNSPFTAALATEMNAPGLTVEQAFKRVRSSVLAATNGRQTPWDTSSLTKDVHFTPPVQKSAQELAADQFFEAAKASKDPVQLVLFLRSYPESAHFEEARKLLAEALDTEAAAEAASVAAETATAQPQPSPEPARAATPVANPAPAAKSAPDEQERALIAAAQVSGKVEDYQAYLDAYPDGVFAELAATEIAAKVAKDPHAPAGGLAAAVMTTPPAAEPATAPPPADSLLDLTFETVLEHGDPALSGKSIAMLITGSPLFPPVEGLPEPIWKDKQCSTCHQWTQDRLCEQANTYLSASNTRALSKEHPYGGAFKSVLRDWASGGCR